MEIHIDRNGERFGPYTVDEARHYLEGGSLQPTDLGWRDGMVGWLPLPQVLLGDTNPRPLAPDVEERQKSKCILTVGILLCVGFVLPLYFAGQGIKHPVLELKSMGTINIINIFMPVIVGATLCSIAFNTKAIARSIVLLSLGVLSLIFHMVEIDDGKTALALGRGLGTLSELMRLQFIFIVFGLGWIGQLAGSGIRWYRPDSKLAFIMATIGGGFLCLFWILPGITSVPVVNIFEFFKGSILLGLASLVFMGLIIAGSVMSFVNLPSKPVAKARKLARLGVWLVVGGFLAFTVLYLLIPLVSNGAGMGGNMEVKFGDRLKIFGMFTTMMLKLGFGLFLLMTVIPLGLMDLLVGRADR